MANVLEQKIKENEKKINEAFKKMPCYGSQPGSFASDTTGTMKAWNDSFDNANWDNDVWQDWNNG